MPAIVPFIPLIVAGVGAASTGIGLYESLHQPGAPKQQQEQPKPPDQSAEKAAFLAAAPSVQERLGGAVAPDFFANEVARVTGNAGDSDLAKSVLSQYLGLGDASGKSGLNPGGGGIGEGGGQNFTAFNSPSVPTEGIGGGGGVGPPNFFESILGGGSGGSGANEFSGGFQ